ncbi:MAG: hypothetical protein A2V59_09795 [Armatimonadetes bacterium RBG_19FT_COMBO_69_19]|nr:MAG: hypothetical protein A2V59_09795 [Armatimonadetes bacterium RBG_19FT_COMBO_69_19]
MKERGFRIIVMILAAVIAATFAVNDAQAAVTCEREVTAKIVALDQPVMFNRIGASNINGMIFALERDVTLTGENDGNDDPIELLRPDKRPRPLVLRVRVGDCLTINLRNGLRAVNPFHAPVNIPPLFTTTIDDQVLDRHVSLHVNGMQYVNGPDQDDGAFVGQNDDSTVARGFTKAYKLFAEKEGAFAARGMATTIGADANQGNAANLLFGEVIVEPTDAAIYRSQVAEEEMRLAADKDGNGLLTLATEKTTDGHPIINYEATYPNFPPWSLEGKAGLPVLNMMCVSPHCSPPFGFDAEIVHSEINAFVAYGPNGTLGTPADGPYAGVLGHFPRSTYPLEGSGNTGLRNPTLPNRLTPFRDFASIFHDEPSAMQAFPKWYDDRTEPTAGQFRYVLAGVKDGFMINYGSGGIGSEIIANRLRVGPMHDCLTCAYEEFFLTSYTVSDPATLVDIPANVGLENCNPSLENCAANGPKATRGLYTEDPANIHHSYTGDFAKIRNVHIGKEQHVFHLHNHQWLYNPNDDNSNYMDAQGVGPGVGYTYEINFGGSGNRNKSAGDAIYHCHFYPHFAQGMWYHWRHHDVFEAGTLLAVTPNDGAGNPTGYHASFTTDPGGLGLGDGTPAIVNAATGARARALPDGEVTVGVPIPALVPLPGKPMAPMPGKVTVVANTNKVCVGPAPTFGLQPKNLDGSCPDGTALRPTGSLALVDRSITYPAGSGILAGKIKNPGYPFWVAGIEDIVGQRPPTPPLDMASAADVSAAMTVDSTLFADLRTAQADGFNGGLPRGALEGYAAGGVSQNTQTAIDFSKVVVEAQGVFYPEYGTDLERAAMAFHAVRNHPTCLPDGTCDSVATPVKFVLNGQKPAIGAPYHEPCIDDEGDRLGTGVTGQFFGPDLKKMLDPAGMTVTGSSVFNAETPRIYKGTNIQYDAVFNKAGYHYSQQRIISLWQDAVPIITKQKAGEPLVMRLNTFDCAIYHHSNLVPEAYEIDDYQVRTPTDIIGQHIHLPKWDLTTADGAANGWNYEDGTFSPGAVRERIRALNEFPGTHKAGTGAGITPPGTLTAMNHPFFGDGAGVVGTDLHGDGLWKGARTTTQRWFADPVVNTERVDRGLGIIFTHDHYGPSTHQQIGLYATVLAEPAGSHWAHNETGAQLGCRTPAEQNASVKCRSDGGPTSWQAAILPQSGAPAGASVLEPYREFYFEYSDFQHAYEAGVYVGTGSLGEPLAGTGPGLLPVALNTGNPDFDGTAANAFRFSINPPARAQIAPVFPDLVLELASTTNPLDDFCPQRPCPQAIDVQDPGMHVVNYRNEPVGLRIYDPNKTGPDGKPGTQADGPAGDLAFALANTDSTGNNIVRKFEVSQNNTFFVSPPPIGPGGGYQVLNVQPKGGEQINGTVFPPPINSFPSLKGPDPYTPMLRTMAGDLIRVKMQAGGHEEEHNATVHGVKWLQAGSGHGKAGNSGWRNAQAGGISEQFTLSVPVIGVVGQTGNNTDYAYSMDASHDGWFSGMWGISRVYNNRQNDLTMLPTSVTGARIANADAFEGPCPAHTEGSGRNRRKVIDNLRTYDITAVLANDVLPHNGDVTIRDVCPGPLCVEAGHVGTAPAASGGTLVYNPRTDRVAGIDAFGNNLVHFGPIHDPTAILYVRTSDLDANGKLKSGVKVEPLILRAGAGQCVQVTLRNRLHPLANVVVPVIDSLTGQQVINSTTLQPVTTTVQNSTTPDLATYSSIQGVVKRDRFSLQGSTTFQTNLFLASSYVGLHPQLVEFDGSRANGILVGTNTNTNSKTILAPGEQNTYLWYAGSIAANQVPGPGGRKDFQLVATAVELGGSNLQPADVVKQGAKSLVGQLVVEPANASWVEVPAVGRASATVTANGNSFRDFSTVWTKALTHYYADSSPVEHMNGEGVGIPEDSQEASGMAINYGIEPLWFRAGILPQSAFGNTGYGGVNPQFDLFSNTRLRPSGSPIVGAIGEPATPVFTVGAGMPFRMRVANPYGTSRGTTFQLHGHVWQRDPYICQGIKDSILGRCATTVVGSQMIGDNKQAFYQGGQESITPATHFDIVVPLAGGKANEGGSSSVTGDFLFRDGASFGSASGLWGILRVE